MKKSSISSQRERPRRRNGKSMRKRIRTARRKHASEHPLTAKQKRELAAIAALPDDQIDTSDIPELSPKAWKDAVRGRFYRPVKQSVSVSLRLTKNNLTKDHA